MFSRSGKPIGLLRIMHYVWNKKKSKKYSIFHIYFWSMAAIFDFSHVRTSDSLRNSLFASLDIENMGIAVGISLISCRKAEIYVISYPLPVNVSHLWFLTDPNIGHSYEYSSRFARTRKHGHSRWNFVAITYITEDIQVLYMYFRFLAAILIFGMDFCHLLFLLSAATLPSWKT